VKKRLDVILVERELVDSRQRAQALILGGKVTVNNQPAPKAGMMVPADSTISIQQPLLYVSRGGYKLAGALDTFGVDVNGLICVDVGASTGGFTDCLLQRGAAHVYALDVGYGQLAWSLRTDQRVTVRDRINVRYLDALPEPADMATIDVSFISLTHILPTVKKILQPDGQAIALIKPQFEAGREQVGKGGIIREASVHRAVVARMAQYAQMSNWRVLGICRSPIEGMGGNAEFFIHLTPDPMHRDIDIEKYLSDLFSDTRATQDSRT
jgi:23S rRNA (cytidine1920-2'-O)/16S rRNA (cytidine1409-2'-O)-methyltransferase